MKLTALCVQDRCETWFKGSKDERDQRILTLMDADRDTPMPASMDFRLNVEDEKQHAPGSLHLKEITISVRAIAPGKGGRLVLSGSLVNGKAGPGAPST